MSPVQLVKASNPLTLACRQALHSRICHGNMEVTLELSWTPLVLRRKQPRTNIKHIVHSFPQHLFWNYRYRQTKNIIVTCDPWLFKPPATRMFVQNLFSGWQQRKAPHYRLFLKRIWWNIHMNIGKDLSKSIAYAYKHYIDYVDKFVLQNRRTEWLCFPRHLIWHYRFMHTEWKRVTSFQITWILVSLVTFCSIVQIPVNEVSVVLHHFVRYGQVSRGKKCFVA